MGNVTQDVPAPTSESHTVHSASSSSTAVRTNYLEQIVACLQQGEMSNEQVEKIAKVLIATKDNKNEEE
jgi:cation transport regulator ChaC